MTSLESSPPPPEAREGKVGGTEAGRGAAPGPSECTHCGLPVPAAMLRAGEPEQFCCPGCRTVYEIIHASGFEAYYRLRDEAPLQSVGEPGRTFEELDDPTYLERSTTRLPEGLRATELYLEGVHCSACMWLVEKSLSRIDGVGEARLQLGRSRLSLVWRPDEIPLSRIAQQLSRLGYTPHPARGSLGEVQKAETRRLVIRIGVAGAVAGNVMLMAFALYGGWISGMEDAHRRLFRFMSLLVSLPAVLYAAWPFYKSALTGLRARVLHMDLPISIGILAGFTSGVANTLLDRGEIYFDSVTTLIFLLLVGRLLQLHQQRRAMESSELLYALTPASARRLGPDGEARRVPLEAITVGDRLEVRAGEVIPTDGIVASGASSVDMSLLSGESMPIPVSRDDEVWGGTTNLQDELVIVATRGVRESRVGKIADMVVEASASRAPVVQLADRVAGGFVGVVLLLALATFSVWSYGDPPSAVDHAVALLIVSCPCALGLATPLAITAAIGKAAGRGILVRSGAALEALGGLPSGTLFFDKTGTLTHGRMDVVRFAGPDWVRSYIAAAERESTHPVGRALRKAMEAGSRRLEPTSVEVVVGGGLIAEVEGKKVVIGSPQFVASRALYDPDLEESTQSWSDEALTPVWVAIDGRVRAVCGLADRIRSEAKESLRALEQLGFEVAVLSGDHPDVVRAVGRQLGLSEARCRGALTPEDKLRWVKEARERGPVIMIGDGVNDAAALAAATVGVAVHGGAETCFQAADVLIQKPGVEPLVDLVLGARRTYRSIRGNIIFSLGYNVAGASLAAFGALNPLLAAVLMPLSSLVVVTNSFRFPFGGRSSAARRPPLQPSSTPAPGR